VFVFYEPGGQLAGPKLAARSGRVSVLRAEKQIAFRVEFASGICGWNLRFRNAKREIANQTPDHFSLAITRHCNSLGRRISAD